jgi:SAM-dependent methyltransferase
MKNEDRWTPSKYVRRGGVWRASLDAAEVGVGSRLIADAVVAMYAEHLPQRARGALADLGCGKAPLYALYRPHASAVTLIDGPGSLHANPHLDLVADLNLPLPLADASFDTLVLSDVLEHIAQPEVLWPEMARLLRPGGRLLLNVPFLYGIHEQPHDYARYTGFALQRFAQRNGLAVQLLVPIGGSAAVLADLLAKHVAVLPLAGPALAQGLQAMVAWLARTGPGGSMEARTAQSWPLGYFMVAAKPDAQDGEGE